MRKKVLIIMAHPRKRSYCEALSESYKQGALDNGAEVKELIIANLEFDPVLHQGYQGNQKTEPDIEKSREMIKWAEHLVIVYPNWWGTYPGSLKGFIDRVFVPGFGFDPQKDTLWWDKLLKGRSARLIVTMDTPPWFYKLVYKQPGHHALKNSTLKYCGIKPVRISSIGPIKTSSQEKRERWIKQIEKLGTKLA